MIEVRSGDLLGGKGDSDGGSDDEDEGEEGCKGSASSPVDQPKLGVDAGEVVPHDVAIVHPEPRRLDLFRFGHAHVWHEGCEVKVDEVADRVAGKCPFGDSSCSSLPYFANKLGVDDVETELFTSPDLCGCHLQGSEEERRFLAGVFGRVCVPEAELFLSEQPMDDITDDLEVAAVKVMLLARSARQRSGYNETSLQERIKKLEADATARKVAAADLAEENQELK